MASKQPRLEPKLSRALAAVSAALAELPGHGMVIGGIASILRGVPRTTRDIDFTISGGHASIPETLEVLSRHGLVPRIPGAARFASENQVLLLEHEPSAIEVDLSLAWLSFEEEAIRNADRMRVGRVELPVARAEDLVIYKVIAWRPQDRQDVERLIRLHGPSIDSRRVLTVVQELTEALGEPERAAAVERLLQLQRRP